MRKEKINTEDIVGKQFEDLEVIKYLGSFTDVYEKLFHLQYDDIQNYIDLRTNTIFK